MPTVFTADALASSRAALAIFLQDLNLHVVGEASDWAMTLATAPAAEPDILLLGVK
jgi:DNA-binding NarL/FixJ family response regulator